MKVDINDRYSASAIKEVRLDGVRLKHCVSADEEAGSVRFYKQDADGQFIPNGNGDEIEMETLHGVVEIILNEDWGYDNGRLVVLK